MEGLFLYIREPLLYTKNRITEYIRQHSETLAFQILGNILLGGKDPSLFLHDCVLCLRRAILAKCRRLTQEILLRGLGVFSTTMKLTGRPDLQSRQRQADRQTHQCWVGRTQCRHCKQTVANVATAASFSFLLLWFYCISTKKETGLTVYRCSWLLDRENFGANYYKKLVEKKCLSQVIQVKAMLAQTIEIYVNFWPPKILIQNCLWLNLRHEEK